MIYWLLRGVGHVLVRILYRVSYAGGSNIPRRGAVLVCANHLSWWDPVIMALACRRHIYFMAKSELFVGKNWAFGLLLRLIGAFPVRRGVPDRKSLARALNLLEKGQAVGIFPEGTRMRTGEFRRAEPGVGLMILRSGAPVVPAYFKGPYKYRQPVSLVIGAPVQVDIARLDDLRTGAQKRQAAADVVMREIAALGGRTEDYRRTVEAGIPPAIKSTG
jgi:1-acyl-sn-glycerol-3-phosphate acyltransferase